MVKVQGPRNRMMYFRLDAGEADELARIASGEDRPVADITRRAVKLYLRGGAEKWAETQAAMAQAQRDPLADLVARAVRSDLPLAEAIAQVATAAHDRQEARAVLLALARCLVQPQQLQEHRARGFRGTKGKE